MSKFQHVNAVGRGPLLLALLLTQAGITLAQSPPYIIAGPQIAVWPGCLTSNESVPGTITASCASITYPTSSPIAQIRYVTVPRGNLEFDLPVSSNVSNITPRGTVSVGISVKISVSGPNPGQTAAQTPISYAFKAPGQATLHIPVNVDWAESLVSFQISIDEQVCNPGTQRNGEPNCKYGQGNLTGPDLSGVTGSGNWVGAEWPDLTNDAFLVFATPAAAFQLSIVPTTIVYGPLGNGPAAASSYSVTELTASNQQFTTQQDSTLGTTNDDKTQYQLGVTLSLGGTKDKTKDDKITAGYTKSGSWDNSTENDSQNSYGASQSVAFETQNQFTITVLPTPGQPSLDKVTSDTQPFWSDVILGVSNPQYALWDYPAGPVIQALGGANLIAMPVRQLDHCAHAVAAVEPTAFVPGAWAPSTAFAQGTVILDSNGNLQVATHAVGISGTYAPNWNANNGGTSADGYITWTNVQSHYAAYRGTGAQLGMQYISIGPWAPNTHYPVGSVILGPASIEVVTTAGVTGASPPTWNTADEATTNDGTAVWTNEQDHIVVSAGPPASHQSVFQWLTVAQCNEYLSLDQFYVNRAQSATPIAYEVLGSMLSLVPTNEYMYSTQNKTTSTFGSTTSSKITNIVTSVESNSDAVSIAGNFVKGVLGIGGSASLTDTSTATTTMTKVDSQALQSSTTITGQAMSSTTIQDMGSERSIPVNVLLDPIFMGIAVQDTNLQPPTVTAAPHAATATLQEALPEQYRALPIVGVGQSSSNLQQAGAPEPTSYVQQTNYGFAMIINKPHNSLDVALKVSQHQKANASRHEPRAIPPPAAPFVSQ